MADSDISNSDEPFEVRDAGGGKGLGCFATRDIKPGETVLVAYTSIACYDFRDFKKQMISILDLYESLSASSKREWGALHGYYNEENVDGYREALAELTRNGVPLTQEQQDEYLHLILAFDSNCFGTDAVKEEMSVMFTRASRFNHSCDPNVSYENNTLADRWVGRANRHIAKGEEMTITYIAPYGKTEERQKDTRTAWGFVCACTKCAGGVDTYTAALEQARDIANKFDEIRDTILYADDPDGMAEQMRIRVTLLRDIVKEEANPEQKKWRSRELAMALWEASIFHRRWCEYWMDDESNGGGGNKEDGLEHSKMDHFYAAEAATVGQEGWSDTHEMNKCLKKEARRAKKTWNRYVKEAIGLDQE